MSILVKWRAERIHVPLPPPDAKLAVIRSSLADYTSLPPQSFKLIHAGAVMKDDNAPISSYGIRENSRIAIIGGDQQPPTAPPLSSSSSSKAPLNDTGSRPTEQSTIDKIRAELSTINTTLVPPLEVFLNTLSLGPSTEAGQRRQNGSAADLKIEYEQEHVRLGEMLLQALLRLDVINLEGEWQEARKERKVAVKEIQGLLDKLDNAWKARGDWVKGP